MIRTPPPPRFVLYTLAGILTLCFSNSFAVTFMALNTEWYWDDRLPHEGKVIKVGDSRLETRYVVLKGYAIAEKILQAKADVVALTEIENKTVLEQIKDYLPEQWRIVFVEGRDTYTGQDVGILTTLEVVPGSETNFPESSGQYKDQTTRPSKILGVTLSKGGQTYSVIVAHLLSKRRNTPKKDNRRAAQANAIQKLVSERLLMNDHVVVMGDINDTPGSITLRELRGFSADGGSAKLAQTAQVDDPNLYSMKGYKELIDHILVSDDLKSRCSPLYTIKTGPISDHLGVAVRCN